MRMKTEIYFCGVGAAINSTSNHSSYLINSTLLIDAPPLISIILKKQNKDIHLIENIIITHLHGDHFFGLPFLLIEFLINKRTNPLVIFGSENLEIKLIELLNLAFPELDYKKVFEAANLKIVTIKNETQHFLSNFINVHFTRVNHGTETYGLLISTQQTKIFFTADTEYFDNLQEIIKNCSYCVADATSLNLKIKGHMSFEDVMKLSLKLPEVTFFVIHRASFEEQEKHQNIIFPQDYESYEL